MNSISLKEGEDDFLAKAATIQRYGAAVGRDGFDETGQADTVERKVEIRERAYRLLVDRGRLRPDGHHLRPQHPGDRHRAWRSTTSTRRRSSRRRARSSAAAPARRCPAACRTCASRSAATRPVRQAMHSAFLYHAIAAGLDMAIVNAGQLEVYEDIPQGPARARRGHHLQPARRRDRAHGDVRRDRQGRGRTTREEDLVAGGVRRGAALARARPRHRRLHRGGHRGGARGSTSVRSR